MTDALNGRALLSAVLAFLLVMDRDGATVDLTMPATRHGMLGCVRPSRRVVGLPPLGISAARKT